MQVNVVGNWFGIDGYSNHTRQLVTALHNEGVKVSVTCNRPENWLINVNDTELAILSTPPNDSTINLMIGMPNFWLPFLSENKPFIGFLIWEGDKIPQSWINTLKDERVTQIWVASKHTKDAVSNTTGDGEILKKIKIVSHGVDLELFKPDSTIEQESEFTFIANKGFRGVNDRGGIQFLLKAFNEEFTKDENVKLIVKVNPAYGIPNIQKILVEELGLDPNKAPIQFVLDNLKYEDMYKFYNKGDVFVSPSMAEAFNLPCLESMACGVPVITTKFGGQSDYVNNDNGWLLKDGELIDVDWDVTYEGVKWMKPSIEELRKALRFAFDNKHCVIDMSKKCLERSKEYTWKHSAIIAKEYLEDVEKKTKE